MQVNPEDMKLIVGVVVVLVIIAIGIALYKRTRKNKTQILRARFGPEYDHTLRESGSESKAEARLADREVRVKQYDIRSLSTTERDRFKADWLSIQSRFVDHPRGAVIEADDLVSSLMQARGYPVADFDQRAADISVSHPRAVQNYRTAHDIALKLGDSQSTTEDMRSAMIHYRSLVDELLEPVPVREVQSVA